MKVTTFEATILGIMRSLSIKDRINIKNTCLALESMRRIERNHTKAFELQRPHNI